MNRPGTRPNILHIVSDQHSPYVAGCFGDPVVATPHLDRLAAQGTVFDAAYCASPICVPSRMSMLTGRFPFENQCWTNSNILDSGIPTFAHALGAAGYRTCLVGRMHSLGPDQLRGYSERLIGDHSPNFEGNPSPPRGRLDGTAGPARVSLTNSGSGQGGYQVHDEYVTAAAVDWLTRRGIEQRSLRCDGPPVARDPGRSDGVSANGRSEQPFLLSVGYMLPHQPFVARHEEFARYQGRVPAPRHPQPTKPEHPYFQWWRHRTGIQEVTQEEIARCRTAYWGLVDRLDAMLGQVFRALDESGLADNTLIVYTSDHGEQAGEHGLWWKQTFYEASARVPLIVAWPGHLPAGQRCPRVVSALDVTATLLDAAAAPALPQIQGRSLLGLLGSNSVSHTGAQDTVLEGSSSMLHSRASVTSPGAVLRPTSDQWEDVAFSEFCVEPGWYQRMVRSGPWKLCHYHGYRPQLFNLKDDPAELHDLAADPRSADVRDTLTQRVLAGWDAEAIARTIEAKEADARILRAWARATQPAETHRWPLLTEYNYLDDELALPAAVPQSR